MNILGEFQILRNDIQIYFLLPLPPMLRVLRVGLSMEGFSKRRERMKKELESPDKPFFFKFLYLGFYVGETKMHTRKPKFQQLPSY